MNMSDSEDEFRMPSDVEEGRSAGKLDQYVEPYV